MSRPESEEKSSGCDVSREGALDSDGLAGGDADGPTQDDPRDPPDEMTALRQQLEAAQAESRDHYDRYVRERAELENFKKRMIRERSDALRFAAEPLLRDLFPVVDNLERALEHSSASPESVVEGVRYVFQSLVDALGRHGVTRVQAAGAKFDPAVHEAMAQVESPDHDPGTVVQQHASGYLLHDRLLRPALVTVSAQKPETPVETPQDSD